MGKLVIMKLMVGLMVVALHFNHIDNQKGKVLLFGSRDKVRKFPYRKDYIEQKLKLNHKGERKSVRLLAQPIILEFKWYLIVCFWF